MSIACQVFLPLPDVLYQPGGFELMMWFLPSWGGNLVLAHQQCLVGLWASGVCQLSAYQLPDVLQVARQLVWLAYALLQLMVYSLAPGITLDVLGYLSPSCWTIDTKFQCCHVALCRKSCALLLHVLLLCVPEVLVAGNFHV